MKKILLTFLLLIFFLYTPSSIKAHGGPPFIKVNGATNQPNLAGASSLFFKIPNEIAASPVLVRESASFEIDTSLVPFDPSLVSSNDFVWDFGDTGSATGLKVNHTYQKASSYVVILRVKDPNYTDPVELETVQVNVVPSKGYEIPKAVVAVNGKKITNPFNEPISVGKNSSVEFDGTDSTGNIKVYKWDFGDGTPLVTGKNQSHEYSFTGEYTYSFFPILRVEDNNGLFSDAVVQISHDPTGDSSNSDSNQATESASSSRFLPYGLASLGILLVGGGLVFIFIKRQQKK